MDLWRRRRQLWWLTLLLAVMPATAGAEDAYRLGVDDSIAVQVLYHPDLSVPSVTVGPDGRISLPAVGEMVVQGRTLAELAATVEEALRAELREPRVSVRLLSRHRQPIYVLGAVHAPGAIEVDGSVKVAEAIALARGLTQTATTGHGLLLGPDGVERRINIIAALEGRGEDGSALVAPGETLLVSEQFLVTVIGQVRSPGRYPVEEGGRAAQALAAAGGVLESAAEHATLVRVNGGLVEVDLERLLQGAEAGANPALESGDLLVVPEARRRVTLVGAFRAPGRYGFEPGDRISDALALAGDLAEDAKPGSAVLVRRDGSSETVDLRALVEAPGEASNPELADGDTVLLARDSDRVAVLGMVTRPGPLPLEQEMTVMDALAAAGGWLLEKSRPRNTIVWRDAPGGPEMIEIDAVKLLEGEEGAENPRLFAGDIVFVPADSAITRDEMTRLLLGVSGLLRIIF